MKSKLIARLAARSAVPVFAGIMLTGCNLGTVGSALGNNQAPLNCAAPPADGGGPTTIVLVDRTTVLEPRSRQRLVDSFSEYWQRDGGRVIVVTTGGVTPSLISEVYRGWLPASTSADKSWSTTPAEARAAVACNERQLRGLKEGLGAALDDIDSSDHALSPLMEAVVAAIGSVVERRGAYRLIFVSDGMHHTQNFSLYTPGTDFLRRAVAPGGVVSRLTAADALPDLTGVEVLHLGIGLSGSHGGGAQARNFRPPEQTNRLEGIWASVYAAGHAESIRFGHPLPTAGISFASEQIALKGSVK